MKAKTLKALKASIKHWERMREHRTHPGASSCAICKLFSNDATIPWEECCVGCPVHNFTGRSHCLGTPYTEAHAAYHYGESPAVWRKAATAEINFLKSLLPK